MRGRDHEAATGVDRHVVDGRRVGGVAGPEQEVTGLQVGQRRVRAHAPLRAGRARQQHAGSRVRPPGEARAVEGVGAGRAPGVGLADLGAGCRQHRRRAGRHRQARAHGQRSRSPGGGQLRGERRLLLALARRPLLLRELHDLGVCGRQQLLLLDQQRPHLHHQAVDASGLPHLRLGSGVRPGGGVGQDLPDLRLVCGRLGVQAEQPLRELHPVQGVGR